MKLASRRTQTNTSDRSQKVFQADKQSMGRAIADGQESCNEEGRVRLKKQVGSRSYRASDTLTYG